MATMRLRPFRLADLAQAGQLLARRHAAHLSTQPLLSRTYTDPAKAQAEVARALGAAEASGVVATVAGRLTGFLIGAPEPGSCWGPNIWIDAAAHAAEDAETVRDLYGAAAAHWVTAGRTAHYVLVPIPDRALTDAWFHLGFGLQQLHGIRDLTTAGPPPAAPAQHRIRRARRTDIDALTALDLTLPDHQSRSPVFSAYRGPSAEEIRGEWERDFDDPAYTTFVAETGGRVIGSAIGCTLTESSLPHNGPIHPDNAAYLGFAAVLPEARGLGAGRALATAIIEWAASSGFSSLVIDWRATNLLSSRAWPKLGFTPYYARLHRVVAY